jgi:UDP-N-acetylglucosamine--N-acetylmuramyl-(pentapeptide) pyrophosphoryl-undecaprenol N-acetylglucosamine transferase
MSSPHTYFIAGGGTGGHLYPAIAIAREILRRQPDAKIHFIGTARGLEARIVPKEGFPLHLLPMSGGLAGSGIVQKLKTLVSLPLAVFQSMSLILKHQPRWILGVGGYASVPMVLGGVVMLRRVCLWEANAFPGMANRWLSYLVREAYLVFENSARYLHASQTHVVGLPVRAAMKSRPRNPSERLRVLVFGGSQGARGINSALVETLQKFPSLLEKIELIHQTGVHDFEDVRSKYASITAGSNGVARVEARAYLESIQEQYNWADVVICRSGASTIAEIATCRKAAVLVPFPLATDDHQTKNAEALANVGAVVLIPEDELKPQRVNDLLIGFLEDPSAIASLENKIEKFDASGSAAAMVDCLLKGPATK